VSVVPKSAPTIATTPARPTNKPNQVVRLGRSAPPVARAKTVPTSGTPAIRMPVSELVRCCSADPSMTQGMAISISANATTQRHRARIGRRSTRRRAMGRRIAVASEVRARTRKAGVTSATATRMNRYGIPQITDINANRTIPRRVIGGAAGQGWRASAAIFADPGSVRRSPRGPRRPSDVDATGLTYGRPADTGDAPWNTSRSRNGPSG
jgi:hypothetical protein